MVLFSLHVTLAPARLPNKTRTLSVVVFSAVMGEWAMRRARVADVFKPADPRAQHKRTTTERKPMHTFLVRGNASGTHDHHHDLRCDDEDTT